MPHDSKGNALKVGDAVVIRGTVTELFEGVEFCNCTVKSDLAMPGANIPTTFQSINTRQLEKVDSP